RRGRPLELQLPPDVRLADTPLEERRGERGVAPLQLPVGLDDRRLGLQEGRGVELLLLLDAQAEPVGVDLALDCPLTLLVLLLPSLGLGLEAGLLARGLLLLPPLFPGDEAGGRGIAVA